MDPSTPFEAPAILHNTQRLAVATPAEPRGEKTFDFLQILGAEKNF